MARDISIAGRIQLETQFSDEVWLWFSTVTHSSLPIPIRVVTEGMGSVSYKNGAIVNYQWGGDVYLGCPFKLEWISDDGQPPRGQLTIPDPDRRIGAQVLTLIDSPQISFSLIKLSDFNLLSYGGNNDRIPLGTPTVEASASHFFLRNVSGDAMQVTADLTTYDMAVEPWPKTRATIDRLPWIGR